MAEIKEHSLGKEKMSSLLFPVILLSFSFIYIYVQLDPKLIYQSQEPVFFFDLHFMFGFLVRPGGINELFSDFLSQLYYNSFTGALLLIVLFGLIAWMTKRFVMALGAHRPPVYMHWIPVAFLLALHSDYTYPLVFTLGLLWILLALNLYLWLSPSNNVLRFLGFSFLHTLLYYIAANQAFIFAITIILYEFLYKRKILLPILCVIFSGILPYIAALSVFILSIQQAFRFQLFYFDIYAVTWLSWILYAFFPFLLIFQWIEKKYTDIRLKKKITPFENIFYPTNAIKVLQGVAVLVLFVLLSFNSYDKSKKAFLQIDYYCHVGDWEKVLDMVKGGRSGRSLVESQAYRALYHLGRLSDELFRYTRHFGGDGLFMHTSTLVLFPRQHSDIFFDLGILNESEHWAYEAIAMNGETAWNIQRLAVINILEGNNDVATRYLDKLKKTVWHRTWAQEYQKVLADTTSPYSLPPFQYLKNAVPETDFLVSTYEPKLCLQEMLNTPGNRMAFEYFMANCLLEGNISQFIQQVHRLNDFGYQRIPRHFEEAILIYIQLTGNKNVGLRGLNISDDTIREFIAFNQTLDKFDKKADRAYRQLEEKYWDTYWFYALYR